MSAYLTKSNLSGAGLILFSLALCISNVSDTVADLRDWHQVGTPAIVAAVMKQIANVIMSAVGGTLLSSVPAAPQKNLIITGEKT